MSEYLRSGRLKPQQQRHKVRLRGLRFFLTGEGRFRELVAAISIAGWLLLLCSTAHAAAPVGLTPGSPAPPLALLDLHGRQFRLEDY